MRIIGYHTVGDMISNSDGEFTRDNYLYWLLTSKPETIRVCYHLDYFVAHLCKLLKLTKEQGKELYDTTILPYGIYELHYVAGKFFNIQKRNSKMFQNFSDMSQYNDAWKLSPDDDPQVKADEARDIGTEVYEAFVEIGLKPTALTSPIRCYEKDVLSKMDLANDADLQSPIGEYAYNCLSGMMVEAYQIGHFEDCYDFDVISAFGFHTANLIDTRFGTWTHNKSYQDKAYYGYAKCKVLIESDFSPIIINNHTPIGEFEAWLPKNKIDFINDYGIGKAEVIQGVWFFPDKIVKPFESICNKLHEKKEQVKGIKRSVIKDILASIWGKRISVDNNGDMGTLFCSPDGINVESGNQIEVAKFVLEHKDCDLLDVVVDGVKVSPKSGSNLLLPSNNGGMGQWKLSSHAPTFILGSGASCVKGKETVNELSINYDWLMKQIQDNPDATSYSLFKTTPRTLGDSVQPDSNWNEVGELIKTERKINFHSDKREFLEYPETGKDLMKQFKSLSLDINQVLNKDIEFEDIEEDETEYPE